jgi:hypothetical protein
MSRDCKQDIWHGVLPLKLRKLYRQRAKIGTNVNYAGGIRTCNCFCQFVWHSLTFVCYHFQTTHGIFCLHWWFPSITDCSFTSLRMNYFRDLYLAVAAFVMDCWMRKKAVCPRLGSLPSQHLVYGIRQQHCLTKFCVYILFKNMSWSNLIFSFLNGRLHFPSGLRHEMSSSARRLRL